MRNSSRPPSPSSLIQRAAQMRRCFVRGQSFHLRNAFSPGCLCVTPFRQLHEGQTVERQLRCYELTVRASRVFVCHSPSSCCLIYLHNLITDGSCMQTKMSREAESGDQTRQPSPQSRQRRAEKIGAAAVGTTFAFATGTTLGTLQGMSAHVPQTSVGAVKQPSSASPHCSKQYVSEVGTNQPINAYQPMGHGPVWGQPSADSQVGAVFVVSTSHRRVRRHLITNLAPCNSVPRLEADVRSGHHPQTARARLRSRSENRLPKGPLASFSPRRRYAYTLTKLVS